MGSVGVFCFSFQEVPDFESVMLLYYMYVCIKPPDTGCNFETIFTKFSWRISVHTNVNHIVFEKNRPLFNKKTFKTLFPIKKLYSFVSSDALFPSKMITISGFS